jgi:hypothetical protein
VSKDVLAKLVADFLDAHTDFCDAHLPDLDKFLRYEHTYRGAKGKHL